MKWWKLKAVYSDCNWISPAFLGTSENGTIEYLSSISPDFDIGYEHVEGYGIPTFVNAHSHAFQYAMAGTAELHNPGEKDDFWSWRNGMYALARNMDPEDIQNVACMLYAEMVRFGYSHVVEFHYLHHNRDGKPYDSPAETSTRLLVAAQEAGIGITILPMFYQQGGFNKSPESSQMRFISRNLEDYQRLFEAVKSVTESYPHAQIGWGIHSVRAVEAKLIQDCLQHFPQEIPMHMHISEQIREVEDCLAILGQRPVEWLAQQTDLHSNINLVHATHLNEQEVATLAKSDCRVVLCPSTEGNLGDGFFALREFEDRGGLFTIGTDSHIGLNPMEEIRMLDYGQRLLHNRRDTFVSDQNGNTGENVFQMVISEGQDSAGCTKGHSITIGAPFDALVLNSESPLFESIPLELIISTAIFTADSTVFAGTIINGQWMVRNGRHETIGPIKKAYNQTMKRLRSE